MSGEMQPQRFSAGPIARRLAGLVIGLMAAVSTVMAVSLVTLGGQLDLILPLALFILFGSGAVSLRRRLR